jgi:hypothetical protein
MTDITPAKGYPHLAGRVSPIPCFEDALMTWDGDIVSVTLTSGQVVSGQLQMSHDGAAAWIIGEWRVRHGAATKPELQNICRERAFRANHIIAVEHIKEN